MSLFISYSRRASESLAKKIHSDLIAGNLAVWWDRKAMESRGQTFLQEIRNAIADSNRVLLIVTPDAMNSEYVNAEWNFALESCTVVTPILAIGEYDIVPESLRSLHTIDFR